MDVPVTMAFLEGFFTFVSPCLLPMIPIYFLYLAGGTTQKLEGKGIRWKMVINSVAFVLGFTIVFTLLGASATAIGRMLRSHMGIMKKVSGAVIILFGLLFLGVFNIGFLNREKRIQMDLKEPGFFSSMIFGAVFSLGWTPCTGYILGTVLLMAGNEETVVRGILLLLVYSLGLGIPFIVSAFLFERLKALFEVVYKYQKLINIIAGTLLVIMGVLVFTGRIQSFQ
ncbi:MAG: cytochrome c biogenesis protein CcdA [Clostridiaceae bacterium]|nr:cytochrome c biogenesis protein CcdA [Clostridiaceae bacterium]